MLSMRAPISFTSTKLLQTCFKSPSPAFLQCCACRPTLRVEPPKPLTATLRHFSRPTCPLLTGRRTTELSEAPRPAPAMEKDAAPAYHIVPITPQDGDKMLEFLRHFFFRDEPLNVEVGLCTKPEDRCEELEEYCRHTIDDGLSLMALSSTGAPIGVILNGGHEPGDMEEIQANADNCPNQRFRKILRLLATVERRVDIFGRYPDVARVLEIRIISVDGAWRGQGVATALANKTRELAKARNYPLIRCDCTSHYSALAMSRLGLECIFSMNYADYKEKGCDEPVFSPAAPHSAVTTYVQTVPV